jgi:hypothetical protein
LHKKTSFDVFPVGIYGLGPFTLLTMKGIKSPLINAREFLCLIPYRYLRRILIDLNGGP